jgi:hypothetical protein
MLVRTGTVLENDWAQNGNSSRWPCIWRVVVTDNWQPGSKPGIGMFRTFIWLADGLEWSSKT